MIEKIKTFKHWHWVLHGAVLLGLLVAGNKYINGSDFTSALRRFHWGYALPIVALTVCYMIVKGWRLAVPLRHVEAVNPWVVVRAYFASYGATLLPGGVTALAGMLKQANVPVAESAAALLLASLLDQAFFISASVIAAMWVPQARPAAIFVLCLLAFIAVLLRVRVTRLWIRNIIEMVLNQFGLLSQWRDFLQCLRLAFNPVVVVPALGLTLLAVALMVWALKLAVSGVGAQATVATALLAYALSSMMGRATPLPGGVGVTEAAMIGLLSISPDISLAQAAAAVVIFRVSTTLLAAAIGAMFYMFNWNGAKEDAVEST